MRSGGELNSGRRFEPAWGTRIDLSPMGAIHLGVVEVAQLTDDRWSVGELVESPTRDELASQFQGRTRSQPGNVGAVLAEASWTLFDRTGRASFDSALGRPRYWGASTYSGDDLQLNSHKKR